MPFTDKEREQYLAEKKKREVAHSHDETTQIRPEPVYVCVHCQNAFAISEGVVTKDVAICDICLGE